MTIRRARGETLRELEANHITDTKTPHGIDRRVQDVVIGFVFDRTETTIVNAYPLSILALTNLIAIAIF